MKILFWGSDGATCVFLSTWVPVPYLVLLPEADLHHPLELRSDLLVAGAVEEEDAAAEDAVEHGEDAVEERSKRVVLGCINKMLGSNKHGRSLELQQGVEKSKIITRGQESGQ